MSAPDCPSEPISHHAVNVMAHCKCYCLLGFADLLATYLRGKFVRVQAGLQAFHEEAVCHTAAVNSLSRGHSRIAVA